jgi:putative oxidoreductase
MRLMMVGTSQKSKRLSNARRLAEKRRLVHPLLRRGRALRTINALYIAEERKFDMKDLGLLTIRLVAGSLLAGHGAQKLFGAFGGYGLEGTAGWLESLGMKPGKAWATAAGLSEFGGGALTALGLAHPVGPLGIISAMSVAIGKTHWNKPIWVTEGGAELPVTNIALAVALMLAGPGRYSLDNALGVKLPRAVVLFLALSAAIGVALALKMRAPVAVQSEVDTENGVTQDEERVADALANAERELDMNIELEISPNQ